MEVKITFNPIQIDYKIGRLLGQQFAQKLFHFDYRFPGNRGIMIKIGQHRPNSSEVVPNSYGLVAHLGFPLLIYKDKQSHAVFC